MKNTKKKLVVSRETLLDLEKGTLQQVHGGVVDQFEKPGMIITCFCPDC